MASNTGCKTCGHSKSSHYNYTRDCCALNCYCNAYVGRPRPRRPTPKEIVEEIVADLSDPRGLGWDQVDPKIKAEIMTAWIKIVEKIS